ncbi:hypothetical protein Pint_17058 [Pistacia integerrima]|uniref:Uncharacterized protein n=1 Tax=Pistacia integerrima TaxID=434235 RepID=A0ACC0ZBA4_9ROSI|nr:hypothetical protein Pint_17058 [Pistacia integerrima]
MAESIVFDIATEVLTKIGSLVGRQVSLLWNLESDLRRLEGTLSSIKAVISDAEKKQARNDQLRDWLRKLKDVLLDAEDVLEEFEFQAPKEGSGETKEKHNKKELCGEEFLKLIVDNSRSVRSIVFPAAEKYGDALLPDSISTLRHLRYLDLTWNDALKKIPESICELQNLQMLRLMVSATVYEVCVKGCKVEKPPKVVSSRQSYDLVITRYYQILDKIRGVSDWELPQINLKMELQGEDRELRLSLKKFIIFDLESLVDLPQLLLQASADTLKYMQIEKCGNLEALPEWFQNLTSLEKLEITRCHKLSSLPKGIERLTSLKELKIKDCPALIESCRNDELKIAHVPVVRLIDE